ncbi:hypothetical protein BJ875DRAFT_537248 [Amylocarpus encephaloides]|uniref:Transcriptional regulator n=1 Tax=Amylocarpus encephaloides TaxID=45428 RepID=A0A9P7YAT1_9HELO|nr:hypothetical protein BJ875DRAFT_537248 [Amylocarpus encephaloides]
MAPSGKILIEKLKSAVLSFFENDRDNLSVKMVRTAVESELHLEQGFFLSPTWKDKSKKIIVEHVEHLDSAGEPEVKPPKAQKKPTPVPKTAAAPPKKRARLQKPTAAENSRPAKRQKQTATPSDEEEQTESSKLSDPSDEASLASDFGDSDASEAPKPKKKAAGKTKIPTKGKGKQKRQVASNDGEEDDAMSEDSFGDVPPPKKQPPVKKEAPKKAIPKSSKVNVPKAKATKAKEEDTLSDDGTSTLTTPSDSDEPPTKKGKSEPKPREGASDNEESPKAVVTEKEEQANASESEMSIVLDEAPKPKRKRKTGSPKAKSANPLKSAPTALSPSEDQIKTLQSHLVKCGIRKIWAFELKQFGTDSKAKIRHLQSMLKDAGMTGRFSESRAREIKETRELQEELAAVTQGEKSWGLESGRASRSKKVVKSMKIPSEDDGDEGDDEVEVKGTRKVVEDQEDDDSDGEPKARIRKPNNDLAFLGSESESE